MVKNILILGGTGVMGTYLINQLSKSIDYNIYITTRGSYNNNGNTYYITGNAHDILFIRPIIESKRWFVIIDFMHYSTKEFKERCDIFLNNTDQYIYLSSARVYSECLDPITEESNRLLDTTTDAAFLRTDDYSLAKARGENILQSNSKKNWTIIRPYMTYWKNKLDLGYFAKELWLYRILHNRKICFPKDVASKYTTLTSGYDVAKAIVSIIGEERAKGEVYHITENNSYKWNDIIDVYKKVLENKGYRFNILYLEKSMIQPEYIYIYDRLYDRKFDNSKINEFVDNKTFVCATEGIKNAIEEFLLNPVFKNIDWKKHAYWDKITNDYTPIKEIIGTKNKIIYIILRYIVSYNYALKLRNSFLYKFCKKL
ncbi:MAG: epimerase [Bacteroidales bacterium]|nr:epimerase [Bacteroidales bacterium]